MSRRPCSNYDSESCARFNEFIRGDERFDFYFIVTHDPAILDSVDRVITVADGKVTEQMREWWTVVSIES